MLKNSLRCLTFVFLLLPVISFASSFTVTDIRVDGLQRVTAGSVFASFPISVGDTVDSVRLSKATKLLYKTGSFDDIKLSREGSVLIIEVKERPFISGIEFDGNSSIPDEELSKGLEQAGLAEGRLFKRMTIELIEQELERQYIGQGRYDADVKVNVEELARNRVALKIDINEGTMAAVTHINIVGNEKFEDEKLLNQFDLSVKGWLSWATGSGNYSREQLSGDLEKLKSWYMDRGYIDFSIESTQVSISPDKSQIFITINVFEGEEYTVNEVNLAGDIVVTEEEIRRLILVEKDQTFSRQLVTLSSDFITKRLGNEGYTFANVNGIPQKVGDEKKVDVTFFVDPQKRAYVRRISFKGNDKTKDEVIRREMRQIEGGWASTDKIEQSKTRLERLGYFKTVNVETPPVPETTDQIDVVYTVEEQSSGSLTASVGFSQTSGLILSAAISQNNWMGTGNRVSFGVSRSDFRSSVNFSYTNPYFTVDGISRGFSMFYQETDYSEADISSYQTDRFGGGINFGYPISNIERIGIDFGVSRTKLTLGDEPAQEISGTPDPIDGVNHYVNDKYNIESSNTSSTDIENSITCEFDEFSPSCSDLGNLEPPSEEAQGFVDEEGDTFNDFTITTSWTRSTLNRGLMPTNGSSQSLSLELSTPISDVPFYKVTYKGQMFKPLTKSQDYVFRLRTEFGYGDSYNASAMPFWEHYYSGGIGSVRGYASNSLGPRTTPAERYVTTAAKDTTCPSSCEQYPAYVIDENGNYITALESDDDPFGGNLLVEGSAELIFPLPFVEDQSSFRTALFFDAGQVYDTNREEYEFAADEIRAAAGVSLSWITPIGPLSFSLAKALNAKDDDDTQIFEFALGRPF
ncbi:outer membrane protein assembly factor BamA [Litoribrevibacter euphylliae]|uniref:Outer membrane protein assembly factor BamA n=1 Tax=Litoribrevibacter euphylliae TaxID=1834034 RepID=A0ABV7HDF6_9GAMM